MNGGAATQMTHSALIDNSMKRMSDSGLPRRSWVVLNRLQTGHERTGYMLHKWGIGLSDQDVTVDTDSKLLHSSLINNSYTRSVAYFFIFW